MVHPAVIHPLTPGSPAYSALKVGAIGSVVALRFVLTRRNRGGHAEEAAPEPTPERQRSPHSVSKKKKKRRRSG